MSRQVSPAGRRRDEEPEIADAAVMPIAIQKAIQFLCVNCR